MKVIIIGRSSDSNVVIDDAMVSKHHLQLIQNNNGQISIVDLNSSNGTFVNGRRIVIETALQPSDQIRIGNTILPWATYFTNVSQLITPTQSPSQPTPNKKRTILYIVLMVLVLIIGGLVGLHYYNENQGTKEKEAALIELQNQEKERELKEREAESTRLRREADEAYTRALESQSAEDFQRAEDTMAKADKAEAETKKMLEEKVRAEAEAKKALEAQASEAKAREEADQRADAAIAAEKKAQQSQQKANATAINAQKAQQLAEETTKLTTQFYAEFTKINNWNTNAVYRKIEETIEETIDSKNGIKEKFAKVDNETKRKIINAIKSVVDEDTKRLAKDFDTELSKLTVDQVNKVCKIYKVTDKATLISTFDNYDNKDKQGVIDGIKKIIENSINSSIVQDTTDSLDLGDQTGSKNSEASK